jgi:hypothetical protein
VNFIDDVNPKRTGGRHVLDVFPELPNLLNASIGRSVNFLHVHGRALCDFKAGVATVAGNARLSFRTGEGFGKDPRDRCLPDASRSTEEVGMGEPVRLDGIDQRVNHVFLPKDVLKNLGTPFPGKNLVRHGDGLKRNMDISAEVQGK